MENAEARSCSTSCFNSETPIETVICHRAPLRRANPEHRHYQTTAEMWSQSKAACRCRNAQCHSRTGGQCLIELNTALPGDPAVNSLVFTQWHRKQYDHVKIYIWVFMAEFLLIAQTWKQLRYPSAMSGISRQWYISTKQKVAIKPGKDMGELAACQHSDMMF